MVMTWTCDKGHETQRRPDGTCTVCVCPHGHENPPRRSNGACILCQKEWYQKNKTRLLRKGKERRMKNASRIRSQQREKYRARVLAETGEVSWEEHLRNKKEAAKRLAKKRSKSYDKYVRSPEQKLASLIRGARNRARKVGLPFDLKTADFLPLPSHCPVLGIPLRFGGGTLFDSPSLDRIVPALGYVKSNVVVISHRANSIKSNASPAEIRKVVDWLEKLRPPENEWLYEE